MSGRHIVRRRFADDLCECVCIKNHPAEIPCCASRVGFRGPIICDNCLEAIERADAVCVR